MNDDTVENSNTEIKEYIVKLEEDVGPVWKLPIEKQAEYADEVCALRINDVYFLKSQLINNSGKKQFKEWNNTSIGNCACISLNAPTLELKYEFHNILTQYIEWKKDQEERILYNPLQECLIL